MANPNRRIGTDWETTVVNFLNEDLAEGRDKAERTGSADSGASDIHMGDWTFEAKAEREIDLPGYLRQLAASVERSGREPAQSAVWVKNRRHPVDDAYVVMSGHNYRTLVDYVETLEAFIREVRWQIALASVGPAPEAVTSGD